MNASNDYDSVRTVPYRYEFESHEIEEIRQCNDEHGFAIVKRMIPQEFVEKLKQSVIETLSERAAAPASTAVSTRFIEESREFAAILAYEPYLRVAHALYDDRELVLNRSAAIYKNPDAPVHRWHTDWEPLEHVYGCNAVLNNTGASSNWFYLNGTRPERGGLACIPDSHRPDWAGPHGFEFTPNRSSFYRRGETAAAYGAFDFPEVLPVISDQGDMVIFSERTYHAVFHHYGNEPRLSCGLSLRPKSYSVGEHWPLPETSREFIASCPSGVKPLVEQYIGIQQSWLSQR